MNERIKELLLQNRNSFTNGVTDTNGGVYIHGSEENLEKFAELIVKETMQVVANQLPSNQYLDVADAVIKHFGVEG